MTEVSFSKFDQGNNNQSHLFDNANKKHCHQLVILNEFNSFCIKEAAQKYAIISWRECLNHFQTQKKPCCDNIILQVYAITSYINEVKEGWLQSFIFIESHQVNSK